MGDEVRMSDDLTYRWSGCERASWRRKGEGWCSHRTRHRGCEDVSKCSRRSGLGDSRLPIFDF